jgi:hypothetical protein
MNSLLNKLFVNYRLRLCFESSYVCIKSPDPPSPLEKGELENKGELKNEGELKFNS